MTEPIFFCRPGGRFAPHRPGPVGHRRRPPVRVLRVTARLVVLVSGSGTNLQALLDASADPGYGAQVVAVGADRDGIAGLTRAADRGVPTFVTRGADFASRDD